MLCAMDTSWWLPEVVVAVPGAYRILSKIPEQELVELTVPSSLEKSGHARLGS